MPKTAEILEIPPRSPERGQNHGAAAIRKMLALGKRDQVVFRVLPDGAVVIAKKNAPRRITIRSSAASWRS